MSKRREEPWKELAKQRGVTVAQRATETAAKLQAELGVAPEVPSARDENLDSNGTPENAGSGITQAPPQEESQKSEGGEGIKPPETKPENWVIRASRDFSCMVSGQFKSFKAGQVFDDEYLINVLQAEQCPIEIIDKTKVSICPKCSHRYDVDNPV